MAVGVFVFLFAIIFVEFFVVLDHKDLSQGLALLVIADLVSKSNFMLFGSL